MGKKRSKLKSRGGKEEGEKRGKYYRYASWHTLPNTAKPEIGG